MRVIAFMLTISVSACVPVIFKQHSIEFLQQPGLKIVKFGKRDLDQSVFRLEVPLEYELTRDTYSVHLEVDGVRVYTKAMDVEGNLLGIMGNPVPVTRSGTYCSAFGLPLTKDGGASPKNKILIYTWLFYLSACFSNEDTKVLSFSVLDEGGNLMGTESLPFDMMSKEFTWEYDSI